MYRMTVDIVTQETTVNNGESIVEQNKYSYPLVLETGRRYVGIEEDGGYVIYEEGLVINIVNNNSCVVEIESSNSMTNNNNNLNGVSIEPEELDKPIDNVVSSLMNDYSVLHGNTSDFR